MLTLLTATGGRPESWARCERLMARQAYGSPVRWVIVDDGETAQPVRFSRAGWTLEVIRREPYWRPGENTQARNLQAGLRAIGPNERVAVIEDDDWYAPDWLATVDAHLDRAELVGECQARYYNIALRRGRQLSNRSHASLCSTALRGGALLTFRAACGRGSKFIDLDLWRRHASRVLFGGHRVVGLKGLPGRAGIGMGHRSDFQGTPDPDGTLLRQWIGNDAEIYL